MVLNPYSGKKKKKPRQSSLESESHKTQNEDLDQPSLQTELTL